ncbi:MAG TPA: hypothetical protein PKD85_01945 [Saprospiraceae bacterium]|nr:hypothetical protein [Saprospiraceae bacterium]
MEVYNSEMFRLFYKRKYCGFLNSNITITKHENWKGTGFYHIVDELSNSIRLPIRDGVVWFNGRHRDHPLNASITLKNGHIKFGRYHSTLHVIAKDRNAKTFEYLRKIGKESWIDNPESADSCADFKNTMLMDINWKIRPWVNEDVLNL